MRNRIRFRVFGAVLLALALLATACGDSESGGDVPDGPTIVVASANFTESQVLAEIYAQALEDAGYPVERRLNLGPREITTPALESNEIDLMPEYTGAMVTFLGGTASTDAQETFDALKGELVPLGMDAPGYAPAEDKDGEVVTAETADELGLEATSDLAQYNGELVYGGPPECPEREFCLIGLQEVYGLDFAEFRPLDVGGPLTVQALAGGEVDVARLFTTDAAIAVNDFVLLEDDMNLHPSQNIVPVLSEEAADAYGQDLLDVLQAVNDAMTTAELTDLNRRAGVEQEDAAEVAADWLADNGITG